MTKNSFFVSKNVLFFEDLFPFHNLGDTTPVMISWMSLCFHVRCLLFLKLSQAPHLNIIMSQNNATTSTDGVDTNCYEEQNTELNDNEILNDAAIEHTDNVVITEVANEADRSRSCEPTANDSSREPAPVTLHRSSRQLCLPSYLRDFHRNMIGKKHVTSTAPYFFGKYLSYESYSPRHKHYLLNVTVYEPTFCHPAVKFQNWRDDMVKK